MTHPGRPRRECADCNAEMELVSGGLRCPWTMPGRFGNCDKPYGRPRFDPASEYARDNNQKAMRP